MISRDPCVYHNQWRDPVKERSILVAFGANLGDRRRTLEAAARSLAMSPMCRLKALSSFRETVPVLRHPDDPMVPEYLNAVGWYLTTESIEQFFVRMMDVERQFGRIRPERAQTPATECSGRRTVEIPADDTTKVPENAGMERRSNDFAWLPRTCDLDLLLAGNEIRSDAWLTIPHPRMCERAFVLEPAAEVAAEMVHPIRKKTIGELWAALNETR
ncbi:MAG: 2-amino-4-hydroxy-6-hydroxymethyldihydropteridine diphosphokinase [Planctomycetia bacterium]|nr:2-amino-4-hydroxy-6-hydroxymethyldihydropteridine diphosphokinase [Planctomycetia bacterium]